MAVLWDKIGALEFIRLSDDVAIPYQHIEEITRHAVDGRAWRKLGIKGDPFELRGLTNVTTKSAADALHDTYAALIGTVVSVRRVDITRTNFLVLDARVTSRRGGGVSVGGPSAGGAILVESMWRLCSQGTSLA
jgi:hypothetical protein